MTPSLSTTFHLFLVWLTCRRQARRERATHLLVQRDHDIARRRVRRVRTLAVEIIVRVVEIRAELVVVLLRLDRLGLGRALIRRRRLGVGRIGRIVERWSLSGGRLGPSFRLRGFGVVREAKVAAEVGDVRGRELALPQLPQRQRGARESRRTVCSESRTESSMPCSSKSARAAASVLSMMLRYTSTCTTRQRGR